MPSKKPRWDYTKDSITNAILDITNNHLTLRQAAQKWGLPRSTLSSRLRGQTALDDQIQPHQLLTRNQEAKLVSWILRQESLGYAPSHSQIRACVLALQKQQGSRPRVGRNWVPRFIERYPELRTKIGRRQEANRFNSFTPKAVHWYFDIREKEYGWIRPENTVNVDKGGIIAGFGMYLIYYLVF
jgi:Tc5 transposase DNA-binding domain/helix-turn-helix, Psq domain